MNFACNFDSFLAVTPSFLIRFGSNWHFFNVTFIAWDFCINEIFWKIKISNIFQKNPQFYSAGNLIFAWNTCLWSADFKNMCHIAAEIFKWHFAPLHFNCSTSPITKLVKTIQNNWLLSFCSKRVRKPCICGWVWAYKNSTGRKKIRQVVSGAESHFLFHPFQLF